LKSGTVTDKVSALTLLIQESPVHAFSYLTHHLLGMARKKARREALLAVDSIKDLMTSNLLADRGLV
jgi:ribosome biogenesis protein MAK21